MQEQSQDLKTYSFWNELKTLLFLAAPIFLGQLAGNSMTFVDTMMSGRAGAINMSAVAVASSIWMPTILFSQGLLMTITPFIAQTRAARGNSSEEATANFMRQGMWLGGLIAIFAISVIFLATLLLRSFEFDPEMTNLAADYLLIMGISIFPFMMMIAQRYYLEGLGHTRPTMFVGLIGLAVNVPLNYVLIFGKFGFPALGALGCAIASVICVLVMCFSMSRFVRTVYSKAFKFVKVDWSTLKKIFVISLPNATAMLMEVSLFALVSLFIAPLGREVVSGHQIALNVSSMSFMMPLALGIAASIRSGYAYGAQDLTQSKLVRSTTLTLSLCVGVFNCTLIYLFREQIASIYSNELPVIQLAAGFMIFTAIYQIVDSIQIASVGLLRGYNDTKAIFVLSCLAYWIIAFPIGYCLAFYGLFGIESLGATGFWIGMVIGLTVGSIFFSYRVFSLERLPAEKLYKKLIR